MKDEQKYPRNPELLNLKQQLIVRKNQDDYEKLRYGISRLTNFIENLNKYKNEKYIDTNITHFFEII